MSDKKDIKTNKDAELQTNELLQRYSSILRTRASLLGNVGIQFGGDRDLYKSLGYKQDLDYDDFEARYKRQDMAKAVIDRPVNATWRDGFELIEGKHEEKSDFEKQWELLNKKHTLQDKFVRVDKLTGIGHYGVLFLGFNDASRQEDLRAPVNKNNDLELLYVKPLGEGSAYINKWVENPADKRFNQPLEYKITTYNPQNGAADSFHVHHSRVVHTVGTLLESEIISQPELEPIFNRLYDLEKIVGGSGEMFWRGARPGFQGKLDEDYGIGDDKIEKLKEQIDEYEHNLRRFIINKGMKLDSLDTQVENPQKHVDVQVEMIAAEKEIPKRILTGSEVGELASSQDRTSWLEKIEGRRHNHAEPHIIMPTIDKLVEYDILPDYSDDLEVVWSDLWSPSEKDKAEIGNIRAKALGNYLRQPWAPNFVPPKTFFRECWGLSDDAIERVIEDMDWEMNQELEFSQGGQEGEQE